MLPTTSTDPINNDYIPTASTAPTTLTDQINNENIPTASAAPTTSTDPINNENIPRTQTISSFTPTLSTKHNTHILPATHATQSTDTQQISHDPPSNKRTISEIISPPPNDTPENSSFPAPKLKKPKSWIKKPIQVLEDIKNSARLMYDDTSVTHSISYETFVDILESVHGTADPISLIKTYTNDLESVLNLLSQLHENLPNKKSKARCTRHKPTFNTVPPWTISIPTINTKLSIHKKTDNHPKVLYQYALQELKTYSNHNLGGSRSSIYVQ
uniref:Uncharacterized protein LOC114345122 n=1 Tax=Diabrotica virgifera virgifera TaxID=50390 RepID=A0A6P7GPB8_DIAVI